MTGIMQSCSSTSSSPAAPEGQWMGSTDACWHACSTLGFIPGAAPMQGVQAQLGTRITQALQPLSPSEHCPKQQIQFSILDKRTPMKKKARDTVSSFCGIICQISTEAKALLLIALGASLRTGYFTKTSKLLIPGHLLCGGLGWPERSAQLLAQVKVL